MIQRIDQTVAPHAPWFVVWAESRAEKRVEQRLAALGLTAWLPKTRERHRWSDRWREVEYPLFPGYLFARTESETVRWRQVLTTPGVLTVVKERGKPALLSDAFVASLRDAIEREGAAPVAIGDPEEFEAGDQVIVQEGVLAGVRGVVKERRAGRSLLIWVPQIGRGVAFTIGSATVRAAQD